MAKVIVKTRFKDILNPDRIYEVGAEVEFSDEARVKNLVSRGLAEVIGEPKGKDPVIFGTIDLSAKAAEIVKAVAVEESVEALKSALEAESKKDKPFKTVVDALAARIAELDKGEDPGELVELADGMVISIVTNPDGLHNVAYGEGENGEKMPLAAGEYRSKTHIYTVGEDASVSVAEITE